MNRYNLIFQACDHGVQEKNVNGKYAYVRTVGVLAQAAAIESHKQVHIQSHSYTGSFIYRVIRKSLWNFQNRLRNNQDRHSRTVAYSGGGSTNSVEDRGQR